MEDSKEAFCRHLSRLGFEVGAPSEWVQQKFRRHVGEERFAEFDALCRGPGGPDRSARIYDFVRDMTEANLLRSIDPDVTVETSYHLYQACRPLLLERPGARVLELACWTGGLAAFIAANHPDSAAVGVDRVERIVGLNRAHYTLANLEFHRWDYLTEKPHKVQPADVLLCGLGTHDLPDGGFEAAAPDAVRQAAGYHRHKSHFAVYFGNWRAAATDGATLHAVLRVGTFGRFLALLDAAREAGWAPQPAAWSRVATPRETLPAFTFTAGPSAPLDEDAALAHYVRVSTAGDPYVRLSGGLALALYRSLGRKTPLHSFSYLDKGWTTHAEVGVSGGAFGYVFERDARPDYRLAIISAADAERERQRLEGHADRVAQAAEQPPQGVYVMPATDQSFFGTAGGLLGIPGAAASALVAQPAGREAGPGIRGPRRPGPARAGPPRSCTTGEPRGSPE